MARSKKACIVFFDEVDAIGGARFDDGLGGDNEVQRTMLEIVNQLDGFDARGNIKVLMATNRYRFLSWWDIYRDKKCFENWTLPTSYSVYCQKGSTV